jgi:hypothetical protein
VTVKVLSLRPVGGGKETALFNPAGTVVGKWHSSGYDIVFHQEGNGIVRKDHFLTPSHGSE